MIQVNLKKDTLKCLSFAFDFLARENLFAFV